MPTDDIPYAIVVEPDKGYTDNGRIFKLYRPDMENDPVRLLQGAADLFDGHHEGVVLINNPLCNDAEDLLRAKGWKFGYIRTPEQGGWTTFQHPDGVYVHLGVRSAIVRQDTPLFDPEESAQIIAARLAQYHKTVGFAWRAMGGLPGHDLIRSFYEHLPPGKQPLWHVPRPVAPNTPLLKCAGAPMWKMWKVSPADLHPGWDYVHEFDMRTAYLAAAKSIELPIGRLHRKENTVFDKKEAGYWLVRGTDLPKDVFPIISDARIIKDLVWLTTPMMTLIQDWGWTLEVIDSYTSSFTRRLLMPWAEKLRDAVYRADKHNDKIMRTSLKVTVARSVSLLSTDTGRIVRPDWYDFIIDLCRANFIRKLKGTLAEARNVQFIGAISDAMFLLSDSDQEPYAYGKGPYIGNFKYEGCKTLDEIRSKYK